MNLRSPPMLARLLRSRRGSLSPLMALLLVPLLGLVALGTEASNWFLTNRAMQNAADSAVLAAATNGQTSTVVSGALTLAEYQWEGRSVSSQYGFTDGSNNTTVTVVNAQTCPDATTACYKVTIVRHLPLWLTQLVGYNGDYTFSDGSKGTTIAAAALAEAQPTKTPDCILALASSGATGITTNGAPKADLAGCSAQSNTGATCHGHNLGLDSLSAVGTDSGCGVTQISNAPAVSDPYSGWASNIPADPCGGSYPQESGSSKKGGGGALPTSNTPSGTVSWGATQTFCGDVQLSGNLTIDSNTTIVIYNGQLDTNGYTIQTATGAGATVIFTGSNTITVSGSSVTPTHAFTGGGTLDLAAPTSGTWAGVSLYQDPSLTSGVDVSAAGNSPTLLLTGLVYMPHASVTLKGAINHASHGLSCFVFVVDNLLIDGTGSIFSDPLSQCKSAGLTTMPYGETTREALVS